MSGRRVQGRVTGLVRLLAAVAVFASLLVGTQTGAVAQTASPITGTITDADGAPVAGVQADLFEADASGNRTRYLTSTRTDADGRFGFDATAGTYAVTIIAPEGSTFDTSRWYQVSFTLADGDVFDIEAQLDGPTDSFISGTVTFENGDPARVAIDLFRSDDQGQRAEYLETVLSSERNGTYRFDVGAGCYVLTFIAPDGSTFNGSRWFQPQICVAADKPAKHVDAVLDGRPAGASAIGGQVTDGTGAPAPGVEITRWNVGADGARTDYLGSFFTGDDGRFDSPVDPGCYWLIYVAPPGEAFNGSPWLERFVCVDPGQTIDDLDAMLDGRDPTTVSVSIADGSVAEGPAGQQTPVALAITLSGAAAADVSFDVAVTGGTATAGADFEAAPTSITIAAGDTAATYTVTVLGDDADEDDETVIVTISNPSAGLTIDDGTGQLTILDDDGQTNNPPSIVDQDFTVEELSSAGTVIGQVVATGSGGSALAYGLDDSSAVAVDPVTGELTVVDPLAMVADTTITVQVTVSNDQGSASAALRIAVTRINTLPNPNSTQTSSGATLEVEITGPGDRTAVPGGPLTVQGQAGVGGTTGAASVTYVVDVSGSTTNSSGRNNDCNGDGVVDEADNFNPTSDALFGTVLDCEIAGLIALNRSLASAPVEVSLVVFGSSAASADVSPADGDQVFTTPTADIDNDGVPDIEQALVSIRSGGVNQFTGKSVGTSTDFDDALNAAAQTIAQRDAGRAGFVFFLSDGGDSAASLGPEIEVLANDGVQVNVYSVGLNGAGCDDGSSLRVISDGTGGECTEVDDPGTLTAALTTAPQGLESVLVSIDGGEPVNAPFNALGQWTVDMPEVGVDRHIIRATVRATDGTEVAAEILVVRVS